MKKSKNIKAGTVISTDDTGNFRSAVIAALGKEQKGQVLSPYGLCTNPPDSSLAMVFNIQGIAANTVAIVDDPKNRKKGLAKGETALVNYLTGSFIYLKEDNGIDIEIEQGSSVKISPDGTITLDDNTGSVVTLSGGVVTIQAATTNITNTAAVNVNAPTITLTGTTAINVIAPTITFTGATAINLVSTTLISMTAPIVSVIGLGGLSATDFSTTNPGTSIASINAHVHEQGNDSNGDSEVPTNPPTYV